MTWLCATIRAIITPIMLTFIDIIGIKVGEAKCVSGQCWFDFRVHIYMCVYTCSDEFGSTFNLMLWMVSCIG
jgi:hypothetical protein